LGASDHAEVRSCMKAWEDWKKDWPNHLETIEETQYTVYYTDWGVAGTADLVGIPGVIDIKTSKKISLINWVQVAFYNRDVGGERWILRLDKGLGTYEYKKCPEEYSQEYL